MDRRTFVKLSATGLGLAVVGVSTEAMGGASIRRLHLQVASDVYPGWEARSVWEHSGGTTAFLHFEQREDGTLWANPRCPLLPKPYDHGTLEEVIENHVLWTRLAVPPAQMSDWRVIWATFTAPSGLVRHCVATPPPSVDFLGLPVEILPVRDGKMQPIETLDHSDVVVR